MATGLQYLHRLQKGVFACVRLKQKHLHFSTLLHGGVEGESLIGNSIGMLSLHINTTVLHFLWLLSGQVLVCLFQPDLTILPLLMP